MKVSARCILLFAGLFVLAASPSLAGKKTEVTSVDIFDPFDMFLGSGPIGAFIDFGTWSCPGNEQTQPCPAGSRTRLRGIVVYSQHASSDPRLNGWSTFDINANWDPNGEGPTWGKWKIQLDDGGVWEGVYNGGKPFGERVEFHGTGGSVDGLLLKLETVTATTYGGGIAWEIYYEGYIVDPHEKK